MNEAINNFIQQSKSDRWITEVVYTIASNSSDKSQRTRFFNGMIFQDDVLKLLKSEDIGPSFKKVKFYFNIKALTHFKAVHEALYA